MYEIIPKVIFCDEKSKCCNEIKRFTLDFLYLDLSVCEVTKVQVRT